MVCTAPPELTGAELLAHLEGEAGTAVEAHLATCAHCSTRARDLARLQDRLAARLYRLTCPPSEALGEFHLGLLPAERAAAVSAHLDGCPHCRREIAALQEHLGALAPGLELSPRERVRVWIGRLVERLDEALPRIAPEPDGSGVPRLAPAYARVRGDAAGPAHRLYEAGDAQVALEVAGDPAGSGRRDLLGLVTGAGPAGLRATLWQDERLVAEAEVDDLGNLSLAGLEPGRYELMLSGPEIEIQIQDLEV